MYYMGTRTVRLDSATEAVLQRLSKRTGLSVSALLKKGIHALDEDSQADAARPYDLFSALELGPGGYAKAPARKSRQGVRQALERKRKKGRL